MSRLLSYCLVALAVETLCGVNALGDDPFAVGPASSSVSQPQGAGTATPARDTDDPFAQDPAADPFGAPPAAAKAQTVPQPKKPAAAKPNPKKRNVPGPQPTTPAEPAAAVAKIKRALDEPTTIEFVDTPLRDVVDFLRDRHHIDIQLDSLALKQAGVNLDTQVTKNTKGISLRSALRMLLEEIPDAEVTFVIHNEVLLITTEEKAERFLDTETYDVADLVVCQDSKAKFWDDYETLTDVIKENVCPQSWTQNGGFGTIKGATLSTAKVLVISQTQEIHEEIAALLKEIRAVAAKKRAEGETGWPQRDPPKPSAMRGMHTDARSKEAPATPPAPAHS